jgi:Zn-dependent protease with chaperone function
MTTAASDLTADQIRLALSRKVEPVRPTALYRFWIAVVALVMVLLPLIYISSVVLLVAVLAAHATRNLALFEGVGHDKHAARFALFLYVGPLVIGSVVVLFMLKPFFANPAPRAKKRELDREREPLLHALVEQICASVGAPRPSRIEVSGEVNAGARREGGFLGFFGGQLVLTIGMPLAAGLSLKQFTGVLAHEFGHFSQGAGMRLGVIIRMVNLWFARVVYERDAWDENLEAMAAYNNVYLQILGGLTRLAVWLARRVLWVLMWAGHFVSSFLSRQMEFDADRYEARMVGGPVLAETMWSLHVMSIAQNGAYLDRGSNWKKRRLADGVAKPVPANVPDLPEEMIAALRAEFETGVTRWFQSHPCDRERIARAMVEAPAEGIFRLDGPASAVFSDIKELSRVVSIDYYRSIVDAGLTTGHIVAGDEFVLSPSGEKQGRAAAERFFLSMNNLMALRLNLPADPAKVFSRTDQGLCVEAFAQARNDLLAARAACLDASERSEEALPRLRALEYATIAHGARLNFDLTSFGFGPLGPDEVKSVRETITQELEQHDLACAPFGAAATKRLALALAALGEDARIQQIADGPARAALAIALYPCLAHLARVYRPSVRSVARSRAVLTFMLEVISLGNNSQNYRVMDSFNTAVGDLATALRSFRAELGEQIKYPFEHPVPNLTLGKFMLGRELPFRDDPAGLVAAADAAVERIGGLYTRVLGRFAETAEAVEESFGFSPVALEESSPASV